MLFRPCEDPRLLEGLRHSCGPVLMNALEDPEVIEIMLVSYTCVICIRQNHVSY